MPRRKGESKALTLDLSYKHCKLCSKKARYGFQKDEPLRCVDHKEESMRFVIGKARECDISGCSDLAKYGWKSKDPIRCKKHRESLMKISYAAYCHQEDCTIIASLGYEYGRAISCR